MVDGSLIFGTGIDNSGFSSGVSNLQAQANVALGNIAADMIGKLSSTAAQIPQQVIAVGSGFEASMSQVAATMGITAAAEEFEILSAAAKEMGETTKFSASQAGEALNYLALAGYDAEKAVSALPTVLNVAAAGGMELASASDMITDAMSALGLETSQMATFADQLAVTAQKSNTSVSQLGEAILTVGGTAKTLSGGVVEMNTALGILADNGIKGSEGGTMLRNVILSLSAPTSTAAAALSELGVTAFDASGAMRPLQDTFADLDTALSTMSDQEKTAVLNEIFNKVDLKSVNALLGTSSERFDELSGYISNCSGAAAQMAATMDDNLKGDLTIMQSALEGLGIAVYEKFQEPMRTAVQDVTSSVGDLTSSLTNGDLYYSFDKISNGFANIVDSGAEFLADEIIPDIIEGAGWVVDNFGTLKTVFITATGAVIAYQTATKGAAAAQGLFTAALNANPLVLAASAIVGVTAAIAAYVIEADAAIKTQEELQQEADEIIAKSNAEANAAEYKAERYKRLYEQYKETGEASLEMKLLAEDLQRLSPETVSLIDKETGAYKELDESINDVIESLRLKGIEQAKQNTMQGYYDNIAKYSQKQIEAEREFMKYQEAIYNAGFTDEDMAEYLKGNDGKISAALDEDYYNYIGIVGDYQGALEDRNAAIEELQAKIDEEEAALDGIDEAYKNLYGDMYSGQSETSALNLGGENYKSSAQMAAEEYAANYRSLMLGTTQEVTDAQADSTEALKSGWENINHAYAMGVITSEQELYNKKAALLQQYGNEELSEHWKYYEELYDQQQEFAEDAKKAAEDAAKEEAEIRDQQWNDISHRAELGLLTAKEAYEEQLEWIQKYCPEYADEWYSYYKTVVDYQREAMKEQVEGVRDSLSETINEYKTAYAELESSAKSYKNRLLSVGDLFSVTTEKDKDGNETTVYNVENQRKQMAEMQKYHDYIKRAKAKGASDEVISELASYDFDEGMFFAKNLAGMSEAELKEISRLQAEKEQLAADLSNELYAPQMEQLNNDLVNSVIAKFGTLPEDIREIGAAALEAFIAGLSDTENLTEKVSDFTDSFFTACDEGISNGMVGFNIGDKITAAFAEQDTYALGKEKGDELVNGFNEALSGLHAQFEAEQSFTALLTAPRRPQESTGGVGTSTFGTSSKTERIVIENHVNTVVQADKKAIGQAAYEYQKEIERRTNG